MRFVSATKGIENGTLLRMSQVIEEVARPAASLPASRLYRDPRSPVRSRTVSRRQSSYPLPMLSWPARSRPHSQARRLRLYTNADPVGVELGAALKNIIAIAAGICAGLNLGSNTMAALITRGLAEISRLAVALGGQPRTLAGLAGLGDLVLTCTGELSRNRSVGVELGQGRKLDEIVSSMTHGGGRHITLPMRHTTWHNGSP